MIRVVIVDDHEIVRRGIHTTLASDPAIMIVGEAARSEEVLGLLDAHPCDVLVLDISLPGRGGMEVLNDVRRQAPNVKVLILSSHDESQYAVRAVRAGAAGYLVKTAAPDELVTAVRAIARSGRYLSEGVAAELAAYMQRKNSNSAALPHVSLSDRELHVLRRIAAGWTVSAIAADLALSVKTISTYKTRLLQKLSLQTTADLVRYAIEHKILD